MIKNSETSAYQIDNNNRGSDTFIESIKRNVTQIKKRLKKKYRECYSQCGEDLILNRIFRDKKNGFYVDIGANNPFEQSNTQFFYNLGWRGINIDALPGSMKVFNLVRPRDINLEIPISDTDEILKYHLFQTSFFNSFDPAPEVLQKEKLIEIREIKSVSLAHVFHTHLAENQIDFMTVDVEGWDLQVLKSNDWIRYRPKILVVEMLDIPAPLVERTEIAGYLKTISYVFFCNTSSNALFFEESFYQEYLAKHNPSVLQ